MKKTSPVSIEKASIEELEKALKEKKIEQAKIDKLNRTTRNKEFVNCLPAILPLLSHIRGSCQGGKSDCNNGFHREHGTAYCPKCVLENIQDWDLENLQIDFDISITQISDR